MLESMLSLWSGFSCSSEKPEGSPWRNWTVSDHFKLSRSHAIFIDSVLRPTEVFAVPFKDFVGYQTSHWTPRMARRYVMRDKSVIVTPFLNYVHEKGIDTSSEHTVA